MYRHRNSYALIIFSILLAFSCNGNSHPEPVGREKTLLNEDWYFFRYGPDDEVDALIYDHRPTIEATEEYHIADAKPTVAEKRIDSSSVLKPWILPTANIFIKNPEKRYVRPKGTPPGKDFPFVQLNFDETNWRNIDLPHDWAIEGPFYEGNNPTVGGGMGRLPVQGVSWYRKKLNFPTEDADKSIFLEVEGAMSYAMVWLNGTLVGGWPYGYNSWQLNLSPYIKFGEINQLAIRIDNPNHSSRWYPGAGIYRNVWLIKTSPIHIGQWGTFVSTKNVSHSSANIDLELTIDNDSDSESNISIETHIYELDNKGNRGNKIISSFPQSEVHLRANEKAKKIKLSTTIENPKLWGPKPTQTPHLYMAETRLKKDREVLDRYETTFGIRDLKIDPNHGLLVNGELIKLQGVNQHHDLGALGAAFNRGAAERQLTLLQEMGCNAIRMSHNPPAPELLDLTDQMGFLVVNEIFDSWERKRLRSIST